MTNPQKVLSANDRAQIIALGVHGIADTFSAHEEAFGHRLKNATLELLEGVARYELARNRDAAGAGRLVHGLLSEADALKSLLGFAKERRLARSATVDVLTYELDRLVADLSLENSAFEDHVLRHHPQGAIADLEPSPAPGIERPVQEEVVPPAGGATSIMEPSEEPYPVSHIPYPVDPLLGPDETPPFRSSEQSGDWGRTPKQPVGSDPEAAVAGLQPSQAVATVPSNLPVSQSASLAERPASSESESPYPISHIPYTKEQADLTDRQSKILMLFTREHSAPLKRVMHLLPMFSEKTVRNDLNALVTKGYLKRRGRAPRSIYVLSPTSNVGERTRSDL